MENKEQRSILSIIKEAFTEDGVLPDNFFFQEEKEGQIMFAPGAMDGIMFYHMMPANDEESEAFSFLKSVIEYASQKDFEKAYEQLCVFMEKESVLPYIDMIHQYMLKREADLVANNLFLFGSYLTMEGTEVEEVKFGMALLEMFNINHIEELQESIRLLALSDEFTLYAAFLMDHWDDTEKELLEAAKKVRGWGRVHLVSMIRAELPETEDWLVLHGVDNDIMPEYSGLDCFKKVHYFERLRDPDLDLPHYRGLANILTAMLDEGPCAGISAVKKRKAVLNTFVRASEGRADLEDGDLEKINRVKEYMTGRMKRR